MQVAAEAELDADAGGGDGDDVPREAVTEHVLLDAARIHHRQSFPPATFLSAIRPTAAGKSAGLRKWSTNNEYTSSSTPR